MIPTVDTEVVNHDRFPASSRYKNARYYQRSIPGIGLRIEPETWTPPVISQHVDDLQTKVAPGEEGRLDLIALRVYRLESLWWVLAYANDIIDPFEEVTVDRVLTYPTFERVASTILV